MIFNRINIVNTKVRIIRKRQIFILQIDTTISLPALWRRCLFIPFQLIKIMNLDILVSVKGIKRITPLQPANQKVIRHMTLVKLQMHQMIPFLKHKILRLLILLQSLNYIRQNLNLLMLRQLRIKIISLKRLLQQWQHHQIRYQQVVITFTTLWQHL